MESICRRQRRLYNCRQFIYLSTSQLVCSITFNFHHIFTGRKKATYPPNFFTMTTRAPFILPVDHFWLLNKCLTKCWPMYCRLLTTQSRTWWILLFVLPMAHAFWNREILAWICPPQMRDVWKIFPSGCCSHDEYKFTFKLPQTLNYWC